jgi:hypothetical protein
LPAWFQVTLSAVAPVPLRLAPVSHCTVPLPTLTSFQSKEASAGMSIVPVQDG